MNLDQNHQKQPEDLLKYIDLNKINLYYVMRNRVKQLEQERDWKHPADKELFREVREKDQELGLLEKKLKQQSAQDIVRDAQRYQLYYLLDQSNQTAIPVTYPNYTLPEESRKKDMSNYLVISPGNVTLQRATQGELGEGVLGVAYPGKNLIKVLDSLYGTDFDEVFRHEVNHIHFPYATERDVRNMTARQLPYQTKYN